MTFDAVLDDNLYPVFNGTPEKTKEWLEARPDEHKDFRVSPGHLLSIISVEQYLKG
jgi:hypothetical protein